MRLLTTIPPRRDGTVTLMGPKGQKFVFKADLAGDLVCEVDDDDVVASALLTGDFEPADPEDQPRAAEIVGQLARRADGADGEGEEDLDDDEPSDPNAMPVEANTPPAPAAAAPTAPRKTAARAARA